MTSDSCNIVIVGESHTAVHPALHCCHNADTPMCTRHCTAPHCGTASAAHTHGPTLQRYTAIVQDLAAPCHTKPRTHAPVAHMPHNGLTSTICGEVLVEAAPHTGTVYDMPHGAHCATVPLCYSDTVLPCFTHAPFDPTRTTSRSHVTATALQALVWGGSFGTVWKVPRTPASPSRYYASKQTQTPSRC